MRTAREAAALLGESFMERVEHNNEYMLNAALNVAMWDIVVMTPQFLEELANHYGDHALCLRMLAEKMRE